MSAADNKANLARDMTGQPIQLAMFPRRSSGCVFSSGGGGVVLSQIELGTQVVRVIVDQPAYMRLATISNMGALTTDDIKLTPDFPHYFAVRDCRHIKFMAALTQGTANVVQMD